MQRNENGCGMNSVSTVTYFIRVSQEFPMDSKMNVEFISSQICKLTTFTITNFRVILSDFVKLKCGI
jgi:hypothetical protein